MYISVENAREVSKKAEFLTIINKKPAKRRRICSCSRIGEMAVQGKSCVPETAHNPSNRR